MLCQAWVWQRCVESKRGMVERKSLRNTALRHHDNGCEFPYKLHIQSSQMPQKPFRISDKKLYLVYYTIYFRLLHRKLCVACSKLCLPPPGHHYVRMFDALFRNYLYGFIQQCVFSFNFVIPITSKVWCFSQLRAFTMEFLDCFYLQLKR